VPGCVWRPGGIRNPGRAVARGEVLLHAGGCTCCRYWPLWGPQHSCSASRSLREWPEPACPLTGDAACPSNRQRMPSSCLLIFVQGVLTDPASMSNTTLQRYWMGYNRPEGFSNWTAVTGAAAPLIPGSNPFAHWWAPPPPPPPLFVMEAKAPRPSPPSPPPGGGGGACRLASSARAGSVAAASQGQGLATLCRPFPTRRLVALRPARLHPGWPGSPHAVRWRALQATRAAGAQAALLLRPLAQGLRVLRQGVPRQHVPQLRVRRRQERPDPLRLLPGHLQDHKPDNASQLPHLQQHGAQSNACVDYAAAHAASS
jgi:hypothetical protein